jgi:hypothetical protein
MHPNMKHALRGWLLLSLFAACFAYPSSGRSEPAPAAPVPSAPAVVTARLVEIPGKPPPDDLYDYAYVMRYEVIGGSKDKASILVAHYKPLLPRSKITGKMKTQVGGKLRSFVKGDIHKLTLTSDLKKIWKGPLIDEFEATDRSSVRYWCLSADPG